MKKFFALIFLLAGTLTHGQNHSPSTLTYMNLLFPNIIQHNSMADIYIDQTILDTSSFLHFSKNSNGDYTSGYAVNFDFRDTAYWTCGVSGNLNTVIIHDPVLLADTLLFEELFSDVQNRDTLIVAYADTGVFGISKYQEFEINYGNNGFTKLILYFYNSGAREEFLNWTPLYDSNGQLKEINVNVSFGGFNLPAQTLVYNYQGQALQDVAVIDHFNNSDTVEKVIPSLNTAYQIQRLNFMQKDSLGEWVAYNIFDFSNQGTSVGITSHSLNDISLFPNPVKDALNVYSEMELELFIYSSRGELVKVIETDKSEKIDVTELKTGVYLLQAKSSKGVQSLKFVKE